MRKILSVCLLCLIARGASAVPSFDRFADATGSGGTSYETGANLASQSNSTLPSAWYLRGGNFGATQPSIAAGSLNYPGLPASTGNSVAFAPANSMSACLDLSLPQGHTNTVYYSFLLKITDLSAVPDFATNNPFAAFLDDPSLALTGNQIGRLGSRLVTKRVGGGYVIGTSKSANPADFIYEPDTAAHAIDAVLFIVASYQRIAGVQTNVSVWIDPPSSSFGADQPPPPTLVAEAGNTALNTNSARAFAILCQFPGAPAGVIDDVRVAINDWAFVTGLLNPVVITAQPNSRTVARDSKAVFAVGVMGSPPLAYQWLLNGASIPGATSFAYTLTNAQFSNAGDYSVIVFNPLNTLTSSVAALTVSSTLRLSDTNLVVVRVGDGAETLTANGNSMSLDQFTMDGDYVSSVNVPEQGTNALITLGPNQVPSPSSVTGTTLSRSADGRFLVVAGYNTSVGYSSALNSSSSAAVPRGIGLFDASAQYSLALASTDFVFSATFWRSAVTDGTNNYWGAGRAPGTYYFGFGAPAVLVQNQFANLRSMALFNGSIYCVSSVSGSNGVLKLNGMPTTTSAPTLLFSGSTGSSDLEVRSDGNLIYVADDRAAALGGGIQRWEFNGSSWTLAYTLTNGIASGVRYVTADFKGQHPIVYAATKESSDDNNRLVRFDDTGPGAVAITIAFAGVNQNFRGVRFGPSDNVVVSRPALAFARAGGNLVLNWSGAFILQSAPEVAGSYADVPSATSPHTNNVSVTNRLFFRLRN